MLDMRLDISCMFALCIAVQKLMLGHCSTYEKNFAVQALMFVRDLDTSLLGQNANGLEQFECLRQCTDELVNAILHVRQLLKRRRFDEGNLFTPISLLNLFIVNKAPGNVHTILRLSQACNHARIRAAGSDVKCHDDALVLLGGCGYLEKNCTYVVSSFFEGHLLTNTTMLCAAPDNPMPAGLRAVRPGPSGKPSARPFPNNQPPSSSSGNSRPQHGYPPASQANGTPVPSNRPPPSPSAKAAAALYRQQPPLLPSHTSQLTASLKGKTKGKRKGWPPSGTTPTWQQQMVTAANRAAEEGSSDQAVGQAPDDAPWSSQRGFSPSPLQAASAGQQAGQQEKVRPHLQPLAEQFAEISESQSHQVRNGLSLAESQSGLFTDASPGLHPSAPQAIEPSRPSYASKVAVSSWVEPTSSLAGASGRHPERPHVGASEQKDSRRKQQHGRGRGSGKNRPPVSAAPAASDEASAGPSVQAGRPAATVSTAQQQSPFASQKSISFGREAATATASAAAAAGAYDFQADTTQPLRQTAQRPTAGSSVKAQPPFAAHPSSSQQHQQQHPPFRESVIASGSHEPASIGETNSSYGDADSSLGSENRDPQLTQKEGKAAAEVEQKAAAAHQKLLASPFNMPTLETLPSFTPPLPASKHKEFPSSRSSHTAAAFGAEAAPSSLAQAPDQPRPASPDAQSAALRAEGSWRARAPPAATDTTEADTALTPNSPGSTPRAEAHSPSRQGQTPWDKDQGMASPRTPLPMPEVAQSALSFKPSSSSSGPMGSCSHSDSGFSLLWDDDPFWQVSYSCNCTPFSEIAAHCCGYTSSAASMILLACNIQPDVSLLT